MARAENSRQGRDLTRPCLYVLFLKNYHSYRVKQKEEENSSQKKRDAAPGQCIGAFIGIHAHKHQAVWKTCSQELACGRNQHTCNPANQSDGNGNRKTSD